MRLSDDEKVLTMVGASPFVDEAGSVVDRWDATNGKEIESFRFADGGMVLALSSDGRYLVTVNRYQGNNNTAIVWDLKKKSKVGSHKLRSNNVTHAAIDKENKRLVLGGPNAEVTVRPLTRGDPISTMDVRRQLPNTNADPNQTPDFVEISHDGKYVISHHECGFLQLWEADTGKPCGQPLKSSCRECRFTIDNSAFLMSNAGSVEFRSVKTLDAIRTLKSKVQPPRDMKGIVISPDGKIIAMSSAINTIHLWAVPELAK